MGGGKKIQNFANVINGSSLKSPGKADSIVPQPPPPCRFFYLRTTAALQLGLGNFAHEQPRTDRDGGAAPVISYAPCPSLRPHMPVN